MKNSIRSFLFPLLLMSTFAFAEEKEFGDHEWIHLYHDQPMYFLLGPPQSKAQISFKAKIFASKSIYLAYTQKIFWDLFEKSSPFRDVNYNPSLFYRIYLKSDSTELIDVIAYEHESNGKSGETSRSWDRSGVRYQSFHVFANGIKLTATLRAWVPLNVEATNRDLPKYRGVYEAAFTVSDFLTKYFDLNDISFRIYSGGKLYISPLRGGRELTVRLKGRSSAFLANAVFQVFQGRGENMLEYSQTHWGIRIGIGI